jgi:RNA polymerase sigma-70 factor, ECF subfamily
VSRPDVGPEREGSQTATAEAAEAEGGDTGSRGDARVEASFVPHRAYLEGLAYRMLGSVSDAQDIVQEAFLRWSGVERAEVSEPRAFLTRVVTRLCLDQLKSARARRESYVGTWLPEPALPGPDEHAHDLSVALLLMLERLSPLERAAFLLHDVFDVDYADVAAALERSEATCRQLAARAREHVRAERPRFEPSPDATERIVAAFQAAVASGDPAPLAQVLSEDAIFYTDGGGKRRAALRPIYGRDKILRFLDGVRKKPGGTFRGQIERTRINGLPGFLLRGAEGVETLALEITGDQLTAMYFVRNPDKLRHLS